MQTFKAGQEIYVKPCGMGVFGRTRVASGLNPLTKKPFDPVVTINESALTRATTFVNTEIGAIEISRCVPVCEECESVRMLHCASPEYCGEFI